MSDPETFCGEILDLEALAAQRGVTPETFYCSFCGRANGECENIIAGPTAFICDTCVELCHDIILSTRAGGHPIK